MMMKAATESTNIGHRGTVRRHWDVTSLCIPRHFYSGCKARGRLPWSHQFNILHSYLHSLNQIHLHCYTSRLQWRSFVSRGRNQGGYNKAYRWVPFVDSYGILHFSICEGAFCQSCRNVDP